MTRDTLNEASLPECDGMERMENTFSKMAPAAIYGCIILKEMLKELVIVKSTGDSLLPDMPLSMEPTNQPTN